VPEESADSNEQKLPFGISLTVAIVGILGGVFGVLGGVIGIFAYFQTERLAGENAVLSQKLTEASNTYVALQTRISACNEIAAHHRRQAAEDKAEGYVETTQLKLPDGSIETMSSNHQRFVASIIMSRALSMCLVAGGIQDLVQSCVSGANSEGSEDYPRFVIDAVDDDGNGSRNLAC
jgi:hypothetical protein